MTLIDVAARRRSRLSELLREAASLASMLRNGHWKVVWERALGRRLHSDSRSLGLRRDLTVPFEPPSASILLVVRPLSSDDIPVLLNRDTAGLSGREIFRRLGRWHLAQSGIGTCYVAATPDGSPCYMQWLIGSQENAEVQDFFGGLFPPLASDEALLEGAYTLDAYRGQGIMPAAMAQIAEKAMDLGARWVITFVEHDNIPALKGCERSGFVPYLEKHDRWRLFRHRVTYVTLPEGTPYPYEASKAVDVSTTGGRRRGT